MLAQNKHTPTSTLLSEGETAADVLLFYRLITCYVSMSATIMRPEVGDIRRNGAAFGVHSASIKKAQTELS